jgi:hypothetical protein
MATGFERDVHRRTTGAGPRLLERKNFCVRLPRTPVIPASHDAAILDYQGADHGIWTGLALTLRCEMERQSDEVAVLCSGSHRVLRVTRDRLRGRCADFVFVIFTFFALARDPDALREERVLSAPAKAPWAAASRAIGIR